MTINQELLDELTEEAKAFERMRMNLDLRDSVTDDSQRMLNAIEPGSTLPIHRHQETSETMVCLRGRLQVEYYDDLGICTESFVTWQGTGTWHEHGTRMAGDGYLA